MHPSVVENWEKLTHPWEGVVPWMYLCQAGVVTVALGNALETPEEAASLDFRRADGSPATRAEKIAAWQRVHAAQKQREIGGGQPFWARLTELRLPRASIDRLVAQTMTDFEAQLRRRWPDWDTWPADAQFALLSWAWAVGAASPYPRMTVALREHDFLRASFEVEAKAAGGKPAKGTLVERNAANRRALVNASIVELDGLDPTVLYYPRDLAKERATTIPPTGLGQVLRQDATRKGVQEALEAERRGRGPGPDDVA